MSRQLWFGYAWQQIEKNEIYTVFFERIMSSASPTSNRVCYTPTNWTWL